MKNIFFLFACLISQLACADFNDASDAYQNKKFQQAFNEFNRLAQLGNKRAQFNLGVMYLNGEFVEQDVFKAFAWGKLSEHSERPEFSQISNTLEKELTADELDKARSTFKAIENAYGDEEIYAKLSPIVYQASDDSENNQPKYKLKVIDRKAPFFPKEALSKGIQGWVTVGFEIFPDGSTRHPYVMESYPEGIFDKPTLEVVQYFKFEIEYDEGIEPYPVFARQTIEYTVAVKQSAQNRVKQIYTERLGRLKSLAEQGSAKAQYVYAIAASSNIINQENRIKAEEVNHWLLKSAQNGHVDAQYHLGRNILRGEGCQVEKQKGIDWIVYAAEQNHPKSSRMAYSLLTQYNNLNNTNKPAEYWLKMSAENGDADSQLDYAEILTAEGQVEALVDARLWLEKNAKQRVKSFKWYQVSAEIYRRQGNQRKAKSHSKKAMKLAKKFGWKI